MPRVHKLRDHSRSYRPYNEPYATNPLLPSSSSSSCSSSSCSSISDARKKKKIMMAYDDIEDRLRAIQELPWAVQQAAGLQLSLTTPSSTTSCTPSCTTSSSTEQAPRTIATLHIKKKVKDRALLSC
eukprot:scaffold988_cov165-Ochromonas_danica.AAC.55